MTFHKVMTYAELKHRIEMFLLYNAPEFTATQIIQLSEKLAEFIMELRAADSPASPLQSPPEA